MQNSIRIISICIIVFGYSFLLVQKEQYEEQKIANKVHTVQTIQKNTNTERSISQKKEPLPNTTHTLTIKIQDTLHPVSFTPGETLYHILTRPENTQLFSLRGIQYPSLGFFVTDIGPLHQGAGKYILYFINGKEASVGISEFVPQIGDTIEWKLK